MNSESVYDPPPPYERTRTDPVEDALDPAVLELAGQSIASEAAPSTPLYQMSRSLDSVTHKDSTIHFERVERAEDEKTGVTAPPDRRSSHLFYLVHPTNARYRTDTHPYYLTSVCADSIGNVRLEAAKSLLQKAEFKALLSVGRSSASSPLFNDKSEELLFHVKPKWNGGQHKWVDSAGEQAAYEARSGDRAQLVVTAPLRREVRDALVATWVLRLWHDKAESRQAQRQALESMTPPMASSDMKFMKRAGAAGGVAGGGC